MKTKISYVVVGAAIALATPLAGVANAADVPLPSHAPYRSAQWTEHYTAYNKEGVVVFSADEQIWTESSGKQRIDVLFKVKPQMKFPTSYVTDGKDEVEYYADSNQFDRLVKSEGRSTASRLRTDTYSDYFLTGKPIPNLSPDAFKREVSEDNLDGRAVVVTTDTHVASTPNDKGEITSLVVKIYYDPATALPLKLVESAGVVGHLKLRLNIEFSDYKTDEPIAGDRFVWKTPDGATEVNRPRVGSVAADFTAVTPEGKQVKLSDHRGKIVILDFWATWCVPCQKSFPHLQSVYDRVKDKNVDVLAVCVLDGKDPFDKWVASHKDTYSFPVALDPAAKPGSGIAADLYRVDSIPRTFVIGTDGKIAAMLIGSGTDDHRIETALAKLGVDIAPGTAAATVAPVSAASVPKQ